MCVGQYSHNDTVLWHCMSADNVRSFLLQRSIIATTPESKFWFNNSSPVSVQAQAFTDSNITEVSSYEELKAAIADRRWARGAWAGHALCCAHRHLPLLHVPLYEL